MRLSFYTLVLLLSNAVCTFGQKPTEFAVSFNNDTVVLRAPFNYEFQSVSYVDAAGKKRKLGPGKIKEAYLGSTHFLGLPTSRGGVVSLQRVVMMNEKYLLTTIGVGEASKFNIYDRRTHDLVERMVTHSLVLKHDLITYDKYLIPYFGDCPEILRIIERGLTKENYGKATYTRDKMFASVSNFDCLKLRETDE